MKVTYRVKLPNDMIIQRKSFRVYSHAVIGLDTWKTSEPTWKLFGFCGSRELAERSAARVAGYGTVTDIRIVDAEVAA